MRHSCENKIHLTLWIENMCTVVLMKSFRIVAIPGCRTGWFPILYGWPYPCCAGNQEHWQCPAPHHRLPAH